MTHSFSRTALILLATSALSVVATTSGAESLRPKYPVRLSDETVSAQPAVLRDGDDQAGQLLLAAHRRGHKAAAPAGPAATYVVKSGDTLEKIAKTLGTTIPDLKAANGLKKNTIQPGDTLKNPKAAPPAAKGKGKTRSKTGERVRADLESAPPEPTTYKVRHGDTLFSISKKLHVPVEALRSENGLSKKAQIHSGQTLTLPGAGKAPGAADDSEPTRGSTRTSRSRRGGAPVVEPAGDYAASGRLVTVDGRAVTYKIRKGDTLDKIAGKLDTTVAQLRRDNRIKGNAISPGRVLKGPHASAKAYVAGAGDTLAGVAERFGVSVAALRAENGLSRRAGVRPGQTMRLPAGYRDRGRGSASPDATAPYTPPRYAPPRYTPPAADDNAPIRTQPDDAGLPSRPQPYNGVPTPPSRNSSTFSGAPPASGPTAAPPPSDAQISQLGRGRFLWPIKGDILSDFGPKTTGQRNDGVNIQASTGDPVHAAADGDVVYAGDQVPGFGNLVLIKHADGWVTAYGHLSHVDVKMQQKVAQGQQIGQVGSTGGVPEPQLHFEIRYAPNPLERARPIDPKLVLPR